MGFDVVTVIFMLIAFFAGFFGRALMDWMMWRMLEEQVNKCGGVRNEG